MKLGKNLINYRKEANLSQEDLAQLIYVSRQTISNWETEKSYPDIQSLLRLAKLFGLTINQLIEGDLEEMKILLNKEDINRFNKDGIKLTIAFIILAISVYPLFYFLSWIGVGIWFLEWLLTMFLALKIKKVKKEYNLKTYRHIVAFSNGKTLDKIQEIEEKAKYPYQKPVIVIGFTIIFTLIVFAVALFIDSFNH